MEKNVLYDNSFIINESDIIVRPAKKMLVSITNDGRSIVKTYIEGKDANDIIKTIISSSKEENSN